MLNHRKNYTTPWLWMMWGLAALFYAYENILFVAPSVMVSEWMRDFHLTAAAIGGLSAYYLYAYASVQIPVGMLMDYFGPRRLLTLATLLCASGALVISYAQGFHLAASGRAMIGLGSGFAAIGCLHIAATCLPLRWFACITGLTLSFGMIGSMAGQAPLAFLTTYFDWRTSLRFIALAGFGVACLIALFVRDFSHPTQHAPLDLNSMERKLWAGIRRVVKHPQSWLIALYGALMYFSMSTFAGLWGIPFLIKAYHVTRVTAASMDSLIFLGFAIGAPLIGAFSDRIKRRCLPLLLATCGAFFALSTLIYFPAHLALWLVNTLLFSFGFFTSGFLPSFSIMRENHQPEHAASSFGFMNMLNMTGGALAQPLVGYLLDHFWSGEMVHGIRNYHLPHFQHALLVLPVGIFISLLFLPFIKETYCQNITQIVQGKLHG